MSNEPTQADMQEILDRQKAAYIAEGVVTAETRIDRIDRAINILKQHGDKLSEAMAADFGHRSLDASKMTDIDGAIGPLEHSKKHLRKWMRSEKRKVMFPLGLFGARGRIDYQPLGVVGCISPWNFPVQLTFAPLAGIFAAGNRTMIKPSEFTAQTSDLMKELFEKEFDIEEVAVFTGGPDVGGAFSRLPFDHLLFTGATSIAKHVMKAAAENLVPVTLELGGKSPVIIGESADLELAANNIMAGKTMNAGQICLAPDYVMLPEDSRDEFVEHARASVARMFPDLKDNPDYTSIVNERHYERLNGYLDDARDKGANVVEINPADEDFSQQEHHRIPPTLVLDPTDDMKVMQDEIFGPLLPVKQYKDVDETLAYVNSKDRPLGLYYFGQNKSEENKVLTHTTSGGVTVNDVIMHVAQEDLPFGGVGPSGMGSYHGYDGFKNFSHAKAIFSQSKTVSKLAAAMFPPYKKAS
ncbi:MAG: coniferyl aldehyde dehydrogenase [Pseudomonadales bacterium]|nr:coniferyl aldehyde dehydrogenase [Pseudomonadales bacterium]MBO6594986.1 coniferyl aldehyde dehydrogenase [Pseudomonadales bacterium]MBO6657453.1 coniferyl aldehyde dehydrogenase [Pseudomonadales bacterium]MBO6701491.1 coniferyl aldehyde dehydrogenase [Pseudomonadales bacterium]MBO6821455.1 coniferyl aldehyde dehydrogenase [Pseudomonadales bacterium]